MLREGSRARRSANLFCVWGRRSGLIPLDRPTDHVIKLLLRLPTLDSYSTCLARNLGFRWKNKRWESRSPIPFALALLPRRCHHQLLTRVATSLVSIFILFLLMNRLGSCRYRAVKTYSRIGISVFLVLCAPCFLVLLQINLSDSLWSAKGRSEECCCAHICIHRCQKTEDT